MTGFGAGWAKICEGIGLEMCFSLFVLILWIPKAGQGRMQVHKCFFWCKLCKLIPLEHPHFPAYTQMQSIPPQGPHQCLGWANLTHLGVCWVLISFFENRNPVLMGFISESSFVWLLPPRAAVTFSPCMWAWWWPSFPATPGLADEVQNALK